MSYENLEGGQEASHHSGEAYRRQVRDYLEAGEFLAIGDDYSGTSDIVLTRPAHKEDKEFRVETKNTKLSRMDKSFIDELSRQFIDFSRSSDDFEFVVFAHDLASQSDWKDIFHDRIRKEDAVRTYYEKVSEKNRLNGVEADQFGKLDFRDFWRFLEQVSIKKAGYGRLDELVDERESQERWKKKWEFYIRENDAVKQPGEIIPNFVKIAKYPNRVWTFSSRVHDHHAVYDQNPRYLPVWFDGDHAYSLLPPDEMPDSLRKFVDTDAASRDDFREWMEQEGDQHRRIVTALLNRRVTWRGVQRYDRCVAVRHDGMDKLIFTVDNSRDKRKVSETKQQDLFGNVKETDEKEEPDRGSKIEGYVAIKDWGSCFAHRYGLPQVKQYNDDHYVFIRTGWLFTERGRGNSLISGARADTLHDQLDKNNRSRNTNLRGQLRQWRSYLGLEATTDGNARLSRDESSPSQEMKFKQPDEMELHERPPKNSTEREHLMSEGRIQ